MLRRLHDALHTATRDAGHLYEDQASGKRDNRPGLEACLKALREGDTPGIAAGATTCVRGGGHAPRCPRCGSAVQPIVQTVELPIEMGLASAPAVTGWTCDEEHFLAGGEPIEHVEPIEAAGSPRHDPAWFVW